MRDVDLESAVMAESQVHPQGAFVPFQLEQTMRVQDENRRRMAVERQRARAMTDFEALMIQQQRQQDYLQTFERSQADLQMQNSIRLLQLQAQLAAAQAAQQVPVQPVQAEKVKVELTEADIYDPSPVFDRPLKRVEGVEID